MAELWQLLLSLGAVGALIALVRALRLGSPQDLTDGDVRLAAQGLVDGFEVVATALDPVAGCALALGRDGRVLLLKTSGAHVAGRVLDRHASVRIEGEFLIVDPADRRFGTARLRLSDADRWTRLIGGI